jgi:hypothetical protein
MPINLAEHKLAGQGSEAAAHPQKRIRPNLFLDGVEGTTQSHTPHLSASTHRGSGQRTFIVGLDAQPPFDSRNGREKSGLLNFRI